MEAVSMEQHTGRRRRPALSCVQCRRRKIKCDRTNPCAHCTSSKSQCSYKTYSDGLGLRDQSEHEELIPPIVRTITSTVSPVPATQQISAARLSTEECDNSPSEIRPAANIGIDSSDAQALVRNRDSEPDLQDVLRRVKKLEQISTPDSGRTPAHSGQDILTFQSDSVYDAQSRLNKARILRWSHWAGTAPEFANIFKCFNRIGEAIKNTRTQCAVGGTIDGQIGDLLQQCKDVARNLKASRPSRNLLRSEFDLELPSREVADMMVDMYFQSFESAYRILHIPTFRTEYRRCWEQPEFTTIDIRLRVLLVIAIGSRLSDHENVDFNFRNLVRQWVYAAQTWLSGPLEKDRLELGGIQIHCLTLLARQLFSIGGDLIWMSTGSLLHSAIQIGLNRSARHLPAMSVLQAELRKRLWATILEMVLQSSLDSAMPPRISLDEFDNEPPSNIDDDEIDQSTAEIRASPRGVFTATSMQLILLDSLPIRLRVLQLLNGLRSEISYVDVLSLSSSIIDACRACSRSLNNQMTSRGTVFHKNLLDFLIRRFLIPLHCPFASKARENPLFYYSLKVSLDTALAIVSPEQDTDFSRLMATGGGSFKEGFRSASTIISLELLAQVENQRLDGMLQHQSGIKDLLKQAMFHMIELSTERIQQGETNVKSHLFLSMIMAEVEATNTGTPLQTKLAQSAKDSLEFCLGLLQARAAVTLLPSNDHDTPTRFVGAYVDYDFDLDPFLLNENFP